MSAAMVKEIERLRSFVEFYATCPCCQKIDQCEDGCTFAGDEPVDALAMDEARRVLSAKYERDCKDFVKVAA